MEGPPVPLRGFCSWPVTAQSVGVCGSVEHLPRYARPSRAIAAKHGLGRAPAPAHSSRHSPASRFDATHLISKLPDKAHFSQKNRGFVLVCSAFLMNQTFLRGREKVCTSQVFSPLRARRNDPRVMLREGSDPFWAAGPGRSLQGWQCVPPCVSAWPETAPPSPSPSEGRYGGGRALEGVGWAGLQLVRWDK